MAALNGCCFVDAGLFSLDWMATNFSFLLLGAIMVPCCSSA